MSAGGPSGPLVGVINDTQCVNSLSNFLNVIHDTQCVAFTHSQFFLNIINDTQCVAFTHSQFALILINDTQCDHSLTVKSQCFTHSQCYQ